MKIEMESTTELAHVNGIPVRVWKGTTTRGTPLLVLVTRVGIERDGHPDDIAELQRELMEPPTRVVDPSGSAIAAPRTCTICNAQGRTGKRAEFIARSADGLQWFECPDHGPGDHAATFSDGRGLPRAERESLEAWFTRHDMPVPGAAPTREQRMAALGLHHIGESHQDVARRQALGPVHGLDPDAYAIEVQENDAGERRVTNRCRFPLVVIRKGAVGPEPLPPGASAELGPDDYVAQSVDAPPDRKHEAVADEVRERLASILDESFAVRSSAPIDDLLTLLDRELERQRIRIESLRAAAEFRKSEPGWLVKDFTALYRAAADTLRDMTLAETGRSRDFLRGQLDRLAGAMGVCVSLQHEAATSGARPAERLTPAEREALAELHRWLHAPFGAGDDARLDAAARAYHVQVATAQREQCEACERERVEGLDEGVVMPRDCRLCGCTDDDCSRCIAWTGGPCSWVEPDLCSACMPAAPGVSFTVAELGYHDRQLSHRAPELWSPTDRQLVDAVAAAEASGAIPSGIERSRAARDRELLADLDHARGL